MTCVVKSGEVVIFQYREDYWKSRFVFVSDRVAAYDASDAALCTELITILAQAENIT